jgi:hypothetical protein
MAGWDTDNGTSVTATDRLRALMPRRRRYTTPRDHVADAAPEASTGLGEDRLRVLADFIDDDYARDTPLEAAG